MVVGDYLRSTALYWLLLACWAVSASKGCERGWFGPQCKYKCHCADSARKSDGSCLKCEGGWFGPECQYVDLAFKKRSAELVTDGDDTTCLSPQKPKKTKVGVNLDGVYPLTWLRVHVNNSELLNKLRFEFESSARGRVECVNQSNVTVDDKTLDLHCGAGILFNRVYLTGEGVAYLCSVYISGGRNVALKQVTKQSTTFSETSKETGGKNVTFVASRAVDGDTSQDFYNSTSCSSTTAENHTPSAATFIVDFSQPYWVYYFIVHFRTKETWTRKYFFLSGLDENNSIVFNYTSRPYSTVDEYTSATTEGEIRPISRVKIEASRARSSYENILTLCEVQIFGDSVCHSGWFGRDCEHACNCAGGTACFVNNGGCPGCAPGVHGPSCNQQPDMTEDNKKVIIGAVVGCILGAIVVALVIIGAVVFTRRRNNTKSQATNFSSRPTDYVNGNNAALSGPVTNSQSAVIKAEPKPAAKKAIYINEKTKENKSSAHPETYYNTLAIQGSTVVSLEELEEFMASNDKDFFKSQFSEISTNEAATMNVGMSAENRNKNIYKNICAYDHSRVYLIPNVAKKQGDYINASYIEGYRSDEKFIASQGPTKAMLEDFVRMLWEQQVEKVVMLTNLVEDGKQKSEKYWPEKGEIKVGDITIKLTTTKVFADYTIRWLQLRMVGRKDQDLVHFHFTSWPEKDIPNTTWGLVDFEQKVASYQSSKPIVIHCSAGVDHTGTFIALRNVMRQAEETGQMDFFTTVQRLRQDRANMVQTVDQYIFLHRAAQVAMLCIGTTVTAKDIQSRIRALESKMGTGQTKMEKEFKSICSVCEVKEEQWTFEENPYTVYVDSLSGVNSRKNRDHSILPKEMYRAKLLRERPDFGDYINAVLVPSFSKQNQQVLTQLPLPATVADFWRLVTQYQVNLIVAFDVDQTATDLKIADYLSPSDEITSSLFKIKKETSSSATYWRQEELVVTIKTAVGKQSQLKTKHHVTHLTSTSTDLNKRTTLSVIQHIKSLQQGHGDGRTLYMCRNGATYSGLVCVLSLLLDRINNDQCLTMPLVVGAIKAVRPEVIPSMDQYKLLYEVANLHSETMREYYNFGSLQNKINNTKPENH